MNRLIIVSAVAATLVAGAFIFWPAPDSTDAPAKPSANFAARADSLPASRESGRFEESRAQLPVVSEANGFAERSAAIAAQGQTTEREDAIRSLAHDWAAEDPVAAERWASSFEDPADLDRALTHVCLEIASHNPKDAIEMAQWHKLGAATVEAIVGQWGESDFAAAAKWVNEVPEGKLRDGLLSRLAVSRAETAPAEAASMVASSLGAGKVQEEAAISVLYQWLRQDPEAAARWVEAFPEGPMKDRARWEVQGMTAYRTEVQKAH